MRIWAKAIKGGKIRKQFVYEKEGKVVYSQFFTYLSEICATLDVAMFNQSTLVLGYLLLYGYDVTGKSYQMRLVGMALQGHHHGS